MRALLPALLLLVAGSAAEPRDWRPTAAAYRARLAALITPTAPADFDCAWRVYALQYAQHIIPTLTAGQLSDIADSLAIEAMGCGNASTWMNVKATTPSPTHPSSSSSSTTFYVDPVNGNDSNPGTQAQPFKTVAAAVAATRLPSSTKPCTVLLRNGTHFLASTVALTPNDSGLTIANFPGEAPVVSGGVPLPVLSWSPFNRTAPGWGPVENNTNNVYGACGEPGAPNMGIMPDWMACQASCQGNATCTAWTYHEGDYPGFTHVCCWRTDGVWSPISEPNITSQERVPGLNVWVADVPAGAVPPPSVTGSVGLPALHVNGHRATLARYPNSNMELDLFPVGYITSTGTWLAPDTSVPVSNYTLTYSFPPEQADPARGIYINYTVGFGGQADRYDPPKSFWASRDFGPQSWMPTSMDDRWQEMHLRSPSGLDYGTALPRAPYANLTQAAIRTWREYHWYSWMFEVAAQSNTTAFTFGRGGHQGGEGCDVAAEWWVEGVLEELDGPNEYFYDPEGGRLYFFPNASDAAPDGSPTGAQLVAPALHTFFSLAGSEEFPVSNVTIAGLTFTAGRPTIYEPHGVPSGGDWALERLGAILAEGTVGLTVSSSLFTRLDSNAVFLSGYNRAASIVGNEFVWLGQSAIALWGRADEWDGTGGQQPRHTLIAGNIAHEIGLQQKQSSFVFQAVSCETTIKNNIAYNLPRAAINFDDGFGGANEITNCLMYNTCRESSDHGAFNRQVHMRYEARRAREGEGRRSSSRPT
jgi:hypothetical protein